MRKLFYFIPTVLLAAVLASFFLLQEDAPPAAKKYTKGQRIDGALKDKLFTSSDVETGEIPYDKLFKAIQEGERRLAQQAHSRSSNTGSLSDAVWRERGPNNIGGRTRAVMVDASDPSRNRIWAGGVSGGLWRTEDITRQDPQWKMVSPYFENISIGDIAQDPVNHATIYVGTGESYTGFFGHGIYKTTDDALSWRLLESTKVFQFVNEIHVHTNGDVYAATSSLGLFRSQDGGETWQKVLGSGLSGATSNDFHDIIYNEVNETFYTSNNNSVFKSTTGNRAEWTNIGNNKPNFPTNLSRVELAVCATNPNFIYVLGATGNVATDIVVSSNGGESWTVKPPPGFAGQDFTNGQAWYDLELSVDPLNCGRLLAGGVPMFEGVVQGTSWSPIGQGQIHVDHHYIQFDEKLPGRVLYGNDGGIWMSNNSGINILSKNQGYVTTQFYCGAIHPEAGSPYLLGGTQDNNTLQITEPGLSPANSVWGGDGVFCFIDQNEPELQIVSSQFGNYGLSRNGGVSFGFGSLPSDAYFINRSGYDDDANILYGQNTNNGFFRWNLHTEMTEEVSFQGITLEVSAVKADPHVPNRVYFGGNAGRVVRLDNAHTGLTATPTLIGFFPGNASISSIYVDRQSPDHILVSLFNYGAALKNVYVTYNGGTDWIAIEGDLPDLPVQWAMFDPANHDRVMIATDAGVWTTDDVNGDFTHWVPTNPDNGMPFVQVDMLVMREDDKVVLAATHGRGLLTTDVFSAPAPVIVSQPIAYAGQPLVIDGSHSVNASSYSWDLGDNNTSDLKKITHTYTEPGVYTITLKINNNDNLQETKTITVLPYLPAPYSVGKENYAGDFESQPLHFAAYSVQGTSFQRGVSDKPGKDGTHSGSLAWVLGINDNQYQNNTRAELYTPQYDLSAPGLYELKFWTKYAIQNRNDGFQIEYSTDHGLTWTQLGSRNDPAWYNYQNAQLADGAFPIGKSYFTNEQLNWKQYVKDISFLGGEEHVSFRYVFRSDATERSAGLVIDDFEVTKYEGELRTTITQFTAAYTGEQQVLVKWTTGIEFEAKEFILERSFTGFAFQEVGRLNATGGITTVSQNYQWVDQSLRNLIYYRVKAINENTETGYYFEFTTPVLVIRRDVDPDIVHTVLTNPFRDRIHVSFSSMINQEVSLWLFDMSGRLVREEKYVPNNIALELSGLRLPAGVYVLSVQIGESEPKSYKLFSEGI